MIPRLYSSSETDFNHMGIGQFSEAISATVTEVANGELDLEIVYPCEGFLYGEIGDGRLIMAKPNPIDEPHLFRIYDWEISTLDNTMLINAHSITNDLIHDTFMLRGPIKDLPAEVALDYLNTYLQPANHRFSFHTDIARTGSADWYFRNILNCLIGEEDSFATNWNGELKRGNQDIWIYESRGRVRPVTIREGKQLNGLTYKRSTKGVVTRIVPFWRITANKSEENPTPEEEVYMGDPVDSPFIHNYPLIYERYVDYTGAENYEQMMEQAREFFNNNADIDKPSINVTVDLVELSASGEVEKYRDLEEIGMFDLITVRSKTYEITLQTKVIRLVYDVLAERNVVVELGALETPLVKAIKNDTKQEAHRQEEAFRSIAQMAANGKNRIYRGNDMPTGASANDLWYRPVGGGELEMYLFNGSEWVLEAYSGDHIGGTINFATVNGINLNMNSISAGDVDLQRLRISNGQDLVMYIDNQTRQLRLNGRFVVGDAESNLTTNFSNGRISFEQNGKEVAYISNNKLYISDGEFLKSVIIGNFAFIPRSNGNLSFKWVGEGGAG